MLGVKNLHGIDTSWKQKIEQVPKASGALCAYNWGSSSFLYSWKYGWQQTWLGANGYVSKHLWDQPMLVFCYPFPKLYSWKGILGSIGNIGESIHTEKTSLLDLESSLRWIWRRDLARSCKRALCRLNWKFWHTVCFRGAVYSIYFPTCYCKPNLFEMKTETTKTKGRYLVLGFVNYI